MRRLVAPRRGEAGVDEDRADQAHDAKRLGECVHQSRRRPLQRPRRPAGPAARRSPPRRESASSEQAFSTSARKRSGERVGRDDAHVHPHVARAGGHGRAVGVRHAEQAARVRAAADPHLERRRARCLRPRRSSRCSSSRRTRARRETASPASPGRRCRRARPACRSHTSVPLAWLATTRVPPSQRAVAGASSCKPHVRAALQHRLRRVAAWPRDPASPRHRLVRARSSGDCCASAAPAKRRGPSLTAPGRSGSNSGRAARRCAGRRTIDQAARDVRAGRARARSSNVRITTAAASRCPSQRIHKESYAHHECTHDSRRPQGAPAGGVGERRLRRHRHHAADRRRTARRSLRPALRRARPRRRRRQRQRDARRGAPRLPASRRPTTCRRCSTAAPSAPARSASTSTFQVADAEALPFATPASTPCSRRSA